MITNPLNVSDFEEIARHKLSKPVYEYLVGGTEDERTVAANRQAFKERWFMPRVLVGVADRDLSCEVFGTKLPYPIILAPTGVHAMFHPEAESETVQGAAGAGALMTLSGGSSVSMEDVAEAGGDDARLWLHLYTNGNEALTEALIRRAEEAGYRALVLTVDSVVPSRHERDYRNGFDMWPYPLGNYPETTEAIEKRKAAPLGSAEARAAAIAPGSPVSFSYNPGRTWEIVSWVKSHTKLPVLVKGILRADDAQRAMQHGADGVWISNHGGRMLDGTLPTLRALEPIARAIGDKGTIVFDGGVRRGTDVLTALALGANVVAVGRAPLYGLAAEGAAGVRKVLLMMRDELSIAMAFTGCRRIADIDGSLVEPVCR